MTKGERCPLCHDPLEVGDVAPCMECGLVPTEQEPSHIAEHTYARYRVLRRFEVVLCNFCAVDIGSYQPSFFGLPGKKRLGFEDLELIKDVQNPGLRRDKYCPTCRYRVGFLNLVRDVRKLHADKD